eukprot:TRINITY_DN18078_c0_g1_i1.p1 TRINITY_DN18078_c0_g1~~TRINITY_DN18078_c0_g1_i1.p1  ORF type:complete len:193 (+),score=34.96 TRINITY_DN18078_c0_g1_i1:57-635(+)
MSAVVMDAMMLSEPAVPLVKCFPCKTLDSCVLSEDDESPGPSNATSPGSCVSDSPVMVARTGFYTRRSPLSRLKKPVLANLINKKEDEQPACNPFESSKGKKTKMYTSFLLEQERDCVYSDEEEVLSVSSGSCPALPSILKSANHKTSSHKQLSFSLPPSDETQEKPFRSSTCPTFTTGSWESLSDLDSLIV